MGWARASTRSGAIREFAVTAVWPSFGVRWAPRVGGSGVNRAPGLSTNPSPWGALLSGAAIAVVIGGVTVVVAVTGGAPTPLAHLYYIPILYAAARHGRLSALVVATASGLAMGPWMPEPSAPSGLQGVGDWGVRLAFFIVVGLVAAWLTRQDPRPLDLILRDVVLSRDLRASVRHRRIEVHYQPLVDLSDGEVIGVEALCRWKDKRGRPVSPAVFIPAAENTGAIMSVGREVLRLSTEQSSAWAIVRGVGLTMSVNVSPVQLCDPGFVQRLADLVGSAADRKYQLCIEITETAIIADPVSALTTLTALREMGAVIALDDFGTGQSSLTYLAQLPIDIIKIDQSFVATVDVDPTSRALVNAVVHIASSLGAVTIAEGIETAGQLKALRQLGCTIGQGYYLGRPVEATRVDWTRRTLA